VSAIVGGRVSSRPARSKGVNMNAYRPRGSGARVRRVRRKRGASVSRVRQDWHRKTAANLE
jgi:hypothetical protein